MYILHLKAAFYVLQETTADVNTRQINPKRQETELSCFSTIVLGFMLKQEAAGRRPVRLYVLFIFSSACCARTAIPLSLVLIKVPAGTKVDGSGNTWSRVLHQVNEGFTKQKQLENSIEKH